MDDLLALIFCSPSGAGKTTLTRHLVTEVPELTFSVSHTTRRPRDGEVPGEAYHFVDRPTFERMIDEARFAEWAPVHEHLYGTSLGELERARAEGFRGMILDVDVQGARQIRARLPDAPAIFVLPPSMTELRRRLVERRSDGPEQVARRLAKAKDEIAHYGSFDYLLINDDLEDAKATVVAIARAELTRRRRCAAHAERLLREAGAER
ncbi:MAG: guanylate kinase [Sandaracinaceae bacterium]